MFFNGDICFPNLMKNPLSFLKRAPKNKKMYGRRKTRFQKDLEENIQFDDFSCTPKSIDESTTNTHIHTQIKKQFQTFHEIYIRNFCKCPEINLESFESVCWLVR